MRLFEFDLWCADFGVDFAARCAFLGSILVRGAPFWTRFWQRLSAFAPRGILLEWLFGAWCFILELFFSPSSSEATVDFNVAIPHSMYLSNLRPLRPFHCLVV